MGKTKTAGNAPVKRGLEASMHGPLAGGDIHRPEFLDLGEFPDLGVVTKEMHAFCLRRDRFGASSDAWHQGIIDTPDVENVGPEFEVAIHSGWWELDDPWALSGKDSSLVQSERIRGCQTNYGCNCQFTMAQSHQCQFKPRHRAWDGASSNMFCASTVDRMLRVWLPNIVEKGDVVLVWGGDGEIGSRAVNIVSAAGGKPVAVISDEDKRQFCLDKGAVGVINWNEFDHWGPIPDTTSAECGTWIKGARAVGRAIWDAVGERKNPKIVIEHPAEHTLPTSEFVRDIGGMAEICAVVSGYTATMDLRGHWMMQRRSKGSHLANDERDRAVNELSNSRTVDSRLSLAFSFDDAGDAHLSMPKNEHPYGDMACLDNATDKFRGAS